MSGVRDTGHSHGATPPSSLFGAKYDDVHHRWTPKCPYGDICTGCDARGRCERAPSRGEQLLGRTLEKETIQGVPHYKPGQHEAVIYPMGEDFFSKEPCQIGRLTYVDRMGHACVILVVRGAASEPWVPTWVGRAGQTTEIPATRAPEGFTLSERMLAALSVAPEVPWPEEVESA